MMMKTTSILVIPLIITIMISLKVQAAPKFNVGVAVEGAIAYQDSSDSKQFYYLPTKADKSIFGDRITSFKATHFGLGRTYFVQNSNGQYTSRSGAILAATGTIDISNGQRDNLKKAIKTAFSIPENKVRLLPLPVRNGQVESVLLDETVGFGDTVEQNFPSSITFGSEFAYQVGSLNSGFARIVGGMNLNDYGITANPTFALNISGESEFVGEPWEAEVSCNLSQAWKDIRTSVNASVSYGWFKLGSASYDSIAQDLEKSGACKFNMVDGSLDTEQYGRQVFDMVKKIFEEINKQARSGQGFFRFESNPQAKQPSPGKTKSGLFGLSVSVNLGRSEASLDQNITWTDTITYTGRFWHPVYGSTVLGINCNEASRQYFLDLGDKSQPCITQEKINVFQERARRESREKNRRLQDLALRLADGKISIEQYDRLLELYNTISFTEAYSVAESAEEFKRDLRSFNISSADINAIADKRAVTGGYLTDSEITDLEDTVIRSMKK